MNKLWGNIEAIEVNGNLSIVSVSIANQTILKSIVIETPESAPHLKKGKEIAVLFKETEVIIGIGNQQNISIQNKIPGIITTIEKGALLSESIINIGEQEITAITTTSAAEELKLQPQMEVISMIKLNEIMLSES